MKKLISIFLVLILVYGCAAPQPRTTIVNSVVAMPPAPEEIVFLDFEWEVWNKARLEQELASQKSNDRDYAIYVLRTEQYETLSINMQDILRWIRQSNRDRQYCELWLGNVPQPTEE